MKTKIEDLTQLECQALKLAFDPMKANAQRLLDTPDENILMSGRIYCSTTGRC